MISRRSKQDVCKTLTLMTGYIFQNKTLIGISKIQKLGVAEDGTGLPQLQQKHNANLRQDSPISNLMLSGKWFLKMRKDANGMLD